MSLSHIKKSLFAIKALNRTTGAMRVLAISLHTLVRGKIIFNKKVIQKLETYVYPQQEKKGLLRSAKKLVVIGSQRGLCGKYNYKIYEIYKTINMHEYDGLVIIGKTLFNVMAKKINNIPYELIASFSATHIDITLQTLYKYINNYKQIDVIYTEEKNLFTHVIKKELIDMTDFLTIKQDFITNCIEYDKEKQIKAQTELNKIYQKYILKNILYKALESEQAIRFTSMDKAYKNSLEIIKQKQLTYNKIRHEKINKELLDIITGSL